MSLTVLAFGYVLMALGELSPKFFKKQEHAETFSFFCALISLVIFASALVNNTYFN